MNFSEIKKWSKEQGFQVLKEKDDSINGASYYWMKISDPNVSGVSLSVSKLATAIFNQLSNNKWADHQKEYRKEITIDEPGTF